MSFWRGDEQLNGPTGTVRAAAWHLLVSTKLWRKIPVSAVLNDGEEKTDAYELLFHIHQSTSCALRTKFQTLNCLCVCVVYLTSGPRMYPACVEGLGWLF